MLRRLFQGVTALELSQSRGSEGEQAAWGRTLGVSQPFLGETKAALEEKKRNCFVEGGQSTQTPAVLLPYLPLLVLTGVVQQRSRSRGSSKSNSWKGKGDFKWFLPNGGGEWVTLH